MENKKWLFTILAVLGIFAIGFFGGVKCTRDKNPEVIEVVRTDTLVVHDTIHHERPVYITQRIVDSIYVPVSLIDTLRIHDTTTIVLPRMQREYRDTLYHAWVSGYDPALDSIDVFAETKYITTTVQKPPKHWHIGVSAGYGAALHDKMVFLSPYVGIGLTYSIFSF